MADTNTIGKPINLDLSACSASNDGGKTLKTLSQLVTDNNNNTTNQINANELKTKVDNNTTDIRNVKEQADKTDTQVIALKTKVDGLKPDANYVAVNTAFQSKGYLPLDANGQFVGPNPRTDNVVFSSWGYKFDVNGNAVGSNSSQILNKYQVAANNAGTSVSQEGRFVYTSAYDKTIAKGRFAFDAETVDPLSGNVNLGSTTNPWNNIYSKTALTVTSDKNVKTEVQLEENIADLLFEKLEAKTFTLNEVVAEKGDEARIHTGYFAQDVAQILHDGGFEPSLIAMWIQNKNETTQLIEKEDGSFEETTGKIIDKEGLKFIQSLRYEEILVALLQGTKNKISTLESRLAALEQR
ncbi:tail fiber domain-containing protein [Commensalibacter papalotli (ex Botero et al. 2024)]|uniref:tail fiber domain-containing protein n=1 Tax=Commensalibacter papalotli (ex Botero et al. 2024) TaxID=2972766 RepID=UPI0022FF6F41|nr:tail fiber domain-containing protein [Commensalibacter papalotli (ex Botero et al. 2024)]CAI3945814.1 unnamed protein product [Commensalibacter papalotli (ex Botero et al. 2024)]